MEKFFPFYEDIKQPISQYSEFGRNSLNLKKVQRKPTATQGIVSRLMSGYTNFDGLLLVHELGSGKTYSSILALLQNLEDVKLFGMASPGVRRGLVITKGLALIHNFKREVVDSKLNINLTYATYRTFSKKIAQMNDSDILNQFDNHLIIIDEAHNLNNLDNRTSVYQNIQRFIRTLRSKKVLLLTGTPMRDSETEIINLFNLIAKEEDTLRMEDVIHLDTLREKVRGYISFYKEKDYMGIKENMGIHMGNLRHIKVFPHYMSDFQSQHYYESSNRDVGERGIYIHSRQAIRLVFPDGTYGANGFEQNIRVKNINSKDIYYIKKDVVEIFRGEGLAKFSAKYDNVIRLLDEACARGEKSIYNDNFVFGSGLIAFSCLLEMNGFTRNFGRKISGPKQFALLTSEVCSSSDIERITNIFNDPLNVDGMYISIIVGSKIISEGLNFRYVSNVHLSPHWNNEETRQASRRGYRMGSLASVYRIYRHASIPRGQGGIDLQMYEMSESKYEKIKPILGVLREVSDDLLTAEGRVEEINDIVLYGNDKMESMHTRIEINTKNKWYYSTRHLSDLSLKLLSSIIENNDFVRHRSGEKFHVRNYMSMIYLTKGLDDASSVWSFYNSWYSIYPPLNIDVTETFKKIVERGEMAIVPDFDNLDSLPVKKQAKLLEISLSTNIRTDRVRRVLNKYKNFYAYVDRGPYPIFHWFLFEIGALRESGRGYDKVTRTWVNVGEQLFLGLREEAKSVDVDLPILGLVNPLSGEFGIKRLHTGIINDKRKIPSGKRCVNWAKTDLVDIVVNILGLRMDHAPDGEIRLTEKLETIVPANADIDTLFALYKFNKFTTKKLCGIIHDELKARDLVIQDYSLGVQTKVK